MVLARVDPERVLAWRSEDGNGVWAFVLEECDRRTRLTSRNRFQLRTLAARIGMLPMEPASLVMERKMLLGIKAARRGVTRRRFSGLGEAVESLRVAVKCPHGFSPPGVGCA